MADATAAKSAPSETVPILGPRRKPSLHEIAGGFRGWTRTAMDWVLAEKHLPLVGALALLVGVLVRLFVENEALRESIGAMSDAIFIAAILSFAVDPILKKQLLDDGLNALFERLYGFNLPPQIKNFYETRVLKADSMRCNCQLHWELEPLDNIHTSVGLHCSFSIANYSRAVLPYLHRVFAISSSTDDDPVVDAMYCRDSDNHFFYECDRASVARLEPDELGYKSVQAISVPGGANGIACGYRWGAHYLSRQTLTAGVDQFSFMEFTAGVEVVVSVHGSMAGYTFSIFPSPAIDAQEQRPKWDMESKQLRLRWTLDRLFLPNEILLIQWRKPADSVGGTSGTAVVAKPAGEGTPPAHSA